ncbi:hypothetical protein LUZ60_002597 [Juncus effusus]|nr:hypothetical protein LUZ60_002597 [Juncus effusus]
MSQSETISESQLETFSGSHRFRIKNYSKTKGLGVSKHLLSSPFQTGGSIWAIQYKPDGDRQEDNCQFISIFLQFLSESGEARAKFDLYLLGKDNLMELSTKRTASHVFKVSSNSWGFSMFLKKSVLESSECLRNDCFVIQCDIVVFKEPSREITETPLVVIPPSDIGRNFADLFVSGEGADVTFDVSGRKFNAHKCVLAARSPVFKAEFFGQMKEKKLNRIKIDDIEPDVFRVLLEFIYSDDLTEFQSVVMTQHLLVAADKYGLERLRLHCEERLCESLDVNNVASILVLADQHSCFELKNKCFEYVSSPRVLIGVVLTDGFEYLKRNCKDLLEEIEDRFDALDQL